MKQDVCKRCVNCRAMKYVDENLITMLSWSIHDEKRWAAGRLYCSWVGLDMLLSDGPPKLCPFFLEHLVMSQGN